MKTRRIVAVISLLLGALLLGETALAAGAEYPLWTARATLAENDGWASAGSGTTGGAAADSGQIVTVHTRDELAAAVAGDTPKIVLVAGVIDGLAGTSCEALADPEYRLDLYLETYHPDVWGRDRDPSGPVEDARVRSRNNQRAVTEIDVGSNTTIYGLRGATLRHLTLMIDRAGNVIVRNLNLEDAADCFPRWRPGDGAAGNWNSEYDLISVRRSTNVWINHNTFSDGDNPDSGAPLYFGRPYQVHDGALDITHQADLVTVSWNVFTNHDKNMLIGSSDTIGPDLGLLNVTVHHNVFDGIVQRAPRVRFGKVDVYNNYYRVHEPFEYSVGIGIQSQTYLENNFFHLSGGTTLDRVLEAWQGTTLTEIGSWARVGHGHPQPVSVLNAYNEANDPDFGNDAGWTPVLRAHRPLPTVAVPILTTLFAGAR